MAAETVSTMTTGTVSMPIESAEQIIKVFPRVFASLQDFQSEVDKLAIAQNKEVWPARCPSTAHCLQDSVFYSYVQFSDPPPQEHPSRQRMRKTPGELPESRLMCPESHRMVLMSRRQSCYMCRVNAANARQAGGGAIAWSKAVKKTTFQCSECADTPLCKECFPLFHQPAPEGE